VSVKPIKKKAALRSAMDIANTALRKVRKKERDLLLSLKKSSLIETNPKKFKLPEPPAGTSTARKLQHPEHCDIVKGMLRVPSAGEMGLSEEGGALHDKMVTAATRQLSSATGKLYSRYIARRYTA
jgi:hypothetical protein